MKTYRTFSSEETKKLGYKLARQFAICPPAPRLRRAGNSQFSKNKHALVFALTGELGAGKTTFIQGFLRGLGIRKRSASPTFVIFRRFMVHSSWFKHVYHLDAYRIKKARELAALEFKEILDDPRNIVLIEWAENIKKILPKKIYKIKFHHGKKENERTLSY
ncbi:MAG: tRNA (adenosine(37)-N6)-threonylcarbamoyltransferase complex ATPase subunit type 1 TsaE [Candidatus Liptonbacteria bacterium]|nr:tRNA (adenosine(37)-N6)-threonylcarbamoyltransferase complex ATPase subunit type 1 TsaE [Candidatus Liptonbacteria bacterium]